MYKWLFGTVMHERVRYFLFLDITFFGTDFGKANDIRNIQAKRMPMNNGTTDAKLWKRVACIDPNEMLGWEWAVLNVVDLLVGYHVPDEVPVVRLISMALCLCPSTLNWGSDTSLDTPTELGPSFHLYRISRMV